MSAKMVGAWADSAATIMRDTLDTCVVKVPNNMDTLLYSIDMQRGVIIGLYWFGPAGNVTHQYFYGYDKGIYFLQKLSCSSSDTSIANGGYRFNNIRINGEPVTSVVNSLRSDKFRFALHPVERGRERMTFIGGKEGIRIAVFNLFGRNLISTNLREKSGTIDLDHLCPATRCPSGPLLLRIATPNGAAAFSTVIVR